MWRILAVAIALASPAAALAASSNARWGITDLGTLGPAYTSSGAAGIDDRGQIAGTSGTPTGKQHAFLWRNGKMTDLGTLGGRDSSATAINGRGQIIGTSLTAKPARSHAFLWQNGKMTDLGTLGGRSSRPRTINERGQIVGESLTATGRVHAFLWWNGKMTDLGTLGGRDSIALAINERGQIVGQSATAAGKEHAFLWRNGKMIDLGTLGRRYTTSSAVAVDDRGQVVGDSFEARVTQTGQRGHAFLWRNGKMTDLGTLGGRYVDSSAAAVSGSLVAGESVALSGKQHPVVWRNERIVDIAPNTTFGSVVAIDGRGRVIGSSVPPRHAVVHAFVWQSGTLVDLGTLGGAESDAAAIDGRRIVGVAETKGGRRHAVLWTQA